jgi:hypothetical protein
LIAFPACWWKNTNKGSLGRLFGFGCLLMRLFCVDFEIRTVRNVARDEKVEPFFSFLS